MAYIDRDIAIRTAVEMCVKVVGHGITQFDAAEIAIAFEDIPTADVVPKSEVERLEEKCAILNEKKRTTCTCSFSRFPDHKRVGSMGSV